MDATKNKAAPSHGTASTPRQNYTADALYSPQIRDVLAALRLENLALYGCVGQPERREKFRQIFYCGQGWKCCCYSVCFLHDLLSNFPASAPLRSGMKSNLCVFFQITEF